MRISNIVLYLTCELAKELRIATHYSISKCQRTRIRHEQNPWQLEKKNHKIIIFCNFYLSLKRYDHKKKGFLGRTGKNKCM
jgi:hypothetical protein